MFGGESKPTPTPSSGSFSTNQEKFKDAAAKLRQEAAEMEVALREEARAKGLPEEVINQLIPIRGQAVAKNADNGGTTMVKVETPTLTVSEVRSKLGYLNAGDPVRFTSELDRIKRKGSINIWDTKDVSKAKFNVNNVQFKSKTTIDPLLLKLDDVGYNYQNVLIAALVFAGVFGLGSSFIGGQLGFILGYMSALVPVTLVGIGSIAPQLIGDIINKVKYATNEESRKRYVAANAAKFLTGYVLGLPVSRFNTGSPSNTVEFFQLRPTGKPDETRQFFSKKTFSQVDISCCSVVCLAGSVAECVTFGDSSGNSAQDVNILSELMRTVEPALSPDAAQNHVRWAALSAWEIINAHPKEYAKLQEAFELGQPLEECIAILEGVAK